ncbi:MAG: LpxL/LpxP family Kdo(2)-lipid IV(A) lauroyl/palmitoleoyl acyltransferase [Gammaproteobacteria bacterium]|jgi:KDO2-lipid IV(A) lauroyltransferase
MYKYLSNPKNWPIFIGYSLICLLTLLPYPILMKLGTLLGKAAYYILRKNRKIIEINIKLCFPNLNKSERQKLVKTNMISYGKAIFETALALFAPDKKITNLYTISGLENVFDALDKKHGVILLCGHFTTIELTGRMLGMNDREKRTCVVYRKSKNNLINHIITKHRKKYCAKLLSNKKISESLRALKNNCILFYAPDENRRNSMVFAPFFGVPAATTTATSRIAKISGAEIVPYFTYRKTDDSGYVINILPAFKNFPSENTLADANRINQFIENAVKQHPDQYMWILKRFRTRPPGEPEIYPKKRKK